MRTVITLHATTCDALDRLSDSEEKVWSREEIAIYLQDGYDVLCRRTKPIFDQVVIENLPQTGNWQTDLEKYFVQQRPGWSITDQRFNMTGEHERSFGVAGAVGGTYRGPAGATDPRAQARVSAGDVGSTIMPGGLLPDTTVDLLRVTYDSRTIFGYSSMEARLMDPQFESRTGGDPKYYVFDKDGLMFVRLVPPALGNAAYDTVDGYWGTMRQTDDTAVTTAADSAAPGWGILRHRTDMFPSGGPWGTPTRVHPMAANVKTEITRLGRDLDTYHFEIPEAYVKYVIFFAMARALRRDGPGQDLVLAEHYEQRFEQGVYKLNKRRNAMTPERIGAFGQRGEEAPFGLGDPQPPPEYGVPQ